MTAHIEIETVHTIDEITQKERTFVADSVQQIPGVAKHLSVQVTQLVTCNLKNVRGRERCGINRSI